MESIQVRTASRMVDMENIRLSIFRVEGGHDQCSPCFTLRQETMINKALKLIRQYHQLKQIELAPELGISKSYLSEIESGKKPVSLEVLEKYSKKFDIPVSSLVFFSESIDKEGKLPKKFRTVFTKNVIDIMEWFVKKNEKTKIKV